jgi:4-carboxymuconolactone decarboxylase
MSKLPEHYRKFLDDFPQVGQSYRSLSESVAQAGPLDVKTRELIKIGISLAAKQEGAVHSHVRKAAEAGASPEEIRHAILQATTTVGFPTMMAGLSWANEVLEGNDD